MGVLSQCKKVNKKRVKTTENKLQLFLLQISILEGKENNKYDVKEFKNKDYSIFVYFKHYNFITFDFHCQGISDTR